MMNAVKWADNQRKEFLGALKGGFFKDIAQMNGGTGELRRELTPKERAKRKTRKNIAKASRKRNR